MSNLSINPLITHPKFRANNSVKSKNASIIVRIDNSQRKKDQQQDLNLSVLRFTFGIPGLDESYLPRWIGYGFGSLLVLNHFLGSNSVTSLPQMRTEALGLSLAAFSIALPYFGRFLKGATPVDQTALPQGSEQIFVMSENVSDTLKEDLAWATYVLLRNTNSIAVLIYIQGELCVRGYWNTPDNISKAQVIDWFKGRIEDIGLFDLKDTLYFPQTAESRLWEMLPRGTRSLLVEPVLLQNAKEMDRAEGFVLLASSIDTAYTDKDRAWIGAVANKFGGENTCSEL
ncbi:protein COFACTOR ASSEMBLY OF COMPLEX C SUBUNIT B CCB2, chloroplastic isoform X1 [Ricinus communis]|uniref:protein COFACTOR ASSEMBLY OF COMPLEX C SUBUNIT B CCB2, chloroplastic isoform X1 n=1 Tax=Ricinus communis TaxID=3988 RepID=UPI000772A249|nr:protein COFACTOR ASSEMBLY OF COMPLEX C SUBUNIT B CCB2, chloroplastic isoform X1 [Ricinus communis]|eukprot:XP_015581753.1 protein COFACTOR ASSEMBLY OF COMPLEX C SUBUNIT B CCB2, chloroplastic isoform X1 [Ricinus communis]